MRMGRIRTEVETDNVYQTVYWYKICHLKYVDCEGGELLAKCMMLEAGTICFIALHFGGFSLLARFGKF